jgi:hypothetical protein
MKPFLRKRRPAELWILLGVALAFTVLVHFRPELTGNDQINGQSGVFLGLFIAAFPAANFLDLLLSEVSTRRWQSIKQADLPWLALNIVVLLAGLTVVVAGTKLFFGHWVPG